MNISKLVKEAKDNNEEAITELIKIVGQKAKYIALSYVKNDDLKADDIVQESYIRAFSNLNQLDDPERFESWFYRIVNNIGINKTKLKLIDKNSSFATDLDYDEDNQFEFEDNSLRFNPKSDFDYEELKKGMQEVLDSLPLAQKEAVYMYYFENLNAREIAEEFDTTEDTVRSRLRYAKIKMKEKIEQLEKQGKSLRGIAPIPFLLWMLNNETKNTIPTKFTVAKNVSPLKQTKSFRKPFRWISTGTKTTIGKIIIYFGIVGVLTYGTYTIQNHSNTEKNVKETLKTNTLTPEEKAKKKRIELLKYALEYQIDKYQLGNTYYFEDMNGDGDNDIYVEYNPSIEGIGGYSLGDHEEWYKEKYKEYLSLSTEIRQQYGNSKAYIYKDLTTLTYDNWEKKINEEIKQLETEINS